MQMRLGFLALDKPETFHGTYHHRNRRLAAILHAGEVDDARDYLAEYLALSAEEVRTAVAARSGA